MSNQSLEVLVKMFYYFITFEQMLRTGIFFNANFCIFPVRALAIAELKTILLNLPNVLSLFHELSILLLGQRFHSKSFLSF